MAADLLDLPDGRKWRFIYFGCESEICNTPSCSNKHNESLQYECDFRNYYQKYDQFLPIVSDYRFSKVWNFSNLSGNFDIKF